MLKPAMLFCIMTFSCLTTTAQQIQQLKISLREAVNLALEKNPSIASSKAGIEASLGRYRSGISPERPNLSVNYDFTPLRRSLKNFGERTVEISQSIDFPTIYFTRGAQLSSRISVAEAELEKTKISLISQVKRSYYNLLAKQENAKTAKENLLLAEDFLSKAEMRSKLGEAGNLELLTARVQSKQARNAFETAESETKVAENELLYALGFDGRNNSAGLILSDSLAFTHINVSPDILVSRAMNSNPDYMIGKANVDINIAGRTLAYSGLLPGFNVSYARQTQDNNPDLYGMSFGISVPLWFLFEQHGQIQEASANLREAEAGLKNLENSIRLNISSSYLKLKNAEKQLKLYREEILAQAEEIFRTAELSYEEGEISYLEFIQAKQTLINSRSGYTDMLLSYNNSIVALEEALGKEIK